MIQNAKWLGYTKKPPQNLYRRWHFQPSRGYVFRRKTRAHGGAAAPWPSVEKRLSPPAPWHRYADPAPMEGKGEQKSGRHWYVMVIFKIIYKVWPNIKCISYSKCILLLDVLTSLLICTDLSKGLGIMKVESSNWFSKWRSLTEILMFPPLQLMHLERIGEAWQTQGCQRHNAKENQCPGAPEESAMALFWNGTFRHVSIDVFRLTLQVILAITMACG